MTIHYLDLELSSDFYGLNTPAVLELETDVQPASNCPDAEDVEIVIGHKLVIRGTPVCLPLAGDKLAALLAEHLDEQQDLADENRAIQQRWAA